MDDGRTATRFAWGVLGAPDYPPPAPRRGPRFGASADCWLCGGAAPQVKRAAEQRIRDLERQCYERGLPCRWGRDRGQVPDPQQPWLPLCQSCETRWETAA